MRQTTLIRTETQALQPLEQVARLLSTARSPALVLERALQVLGETLGAYGATIVLTDEAPKRLRGCSWGQYQQQLLEMGQELVDGINVQSATTARHAILPGVAGARAAEGVLL